jgi:hypothetical protein
MAIARIRKWYDEHREERGYEESGLCRKILDNIVGFDLNPLAVMAARTNYLIAIRDLIVHMNGIEIPIYLCDSIMTPSEHGGLFAGSLETARELKTAVGAFIIPTEIAQTQRSIAQYADLLEESVRNKYSSDEFISRCKEEHISVTQEKLHSELYKQLVKLDKDKRNGVWARIIKNAFAPLFTAQVDYVVGNPPWVNWESLPDVYRQSTAPLWYDYGLFRQKGLKARLGGAKDDISILMTYVCHDAYLKQTGTLGFLITQSVFKTKGGGEGFRGFRYTPAGKLEMYLAPLDVEDLSALQPFEGATNRTAVFVTGKSDVPVKYPVPYCLWKKKKGSSIDNDGTLKNVLSKVDRRALLAKPVEKNDPRSPWITASKPVLKALTDLSGSSTYTSRKGVYCPTNAIYWITNAQKGPGKALIVTNLADTGKKKVRKVTVAVEDAFVNRLVRGKDIGRWIWKSEFQIILPQDPDYPSKAMSEGTLKIKFPKTFGYFKSFEKEIRNCALLKQFFDPQVDPFYSSYNVGEYSYAPYKVIWKEICPEIEAAVIAEGENVIPDHKLVLVSFDQPEPAYFLSALLNSSPVSLFVRSYTVQTSISGHIFDYVALPQYSKGNNLHQKIATLAADCHLKSGSKLAVLEAELDELVADILGISAANVKIMRDELDLLRGGDTFEEDSED